MALAGTTCSGMLLRLCIFALIIDQSVLSGQWVLKPIPYHDGKRGDCQQGFSWSSVDYGGHWKLLHYAVRKTFKPMAVSGAVHQRSPLRLPMGMSLTDAVPNVLRWSESRMSAETWVLRCRAPIAISITCCSALLLPRHTTGQRLTALHVAIDSDGLACG